MLPLRPAVPGLAGLQALMERQRSALVEGRADDLHALGAQIRQQIAQIKQAAGQVGPPPADAQARSEIEQLNQLATMNLELLQRRLVETQSAIGALGAGVPALEESKAMTTYEAAGRMEAGHVGKRTLGQA
ncbi:hypothetical protein JI739_23495 [Ramlibacter sp. AW1]|uniref:Uncharacterized protein n=1 Tax=Ramlibacter aurantiacus TaxID=2801330 RepID=A0A937D9L8_9BURK|nr:hypothetical protein [Ramlibacter aurantiacus]MBL0423321.1 hypothetical protein [Ramlibacter aurantiacus]